MASGNCTPAEMLEYILQYGTHAGWPKASRMQGAVMAMTRHYEAGLGWDGDLDALRKGRAPLDP